VLAAEHLLGLAGVDLRGEVLERAAQVVGHRLAGLGPLDQDGKVVDAPLQSFAEVAIFFEAAAPLEQLLRAGLVFPEIRVSDALFDPGELVGGSGGVKDSSAGRRRGAPDPRTCEAARRFEGS
jgi:hypothetical protein